MSDRQLFELLTQSRAALFALKHLHFRSIPTAAASACDEVLLVSEVVFFFVRRAFDHVVLWPLSPVHNTLHILVDTLH